MMVKSVKSLLALVLVMAATAAYAQDNVDELIARLASSRVTFDYELSIEKPGQKGPVTRMQGKVVLQGGCYRAEGNGLTVISDGITRWTVDSESKEVYLESANDGNDIVSNPERLLAGASGIKQSAGTVSGTYTDPETKEVMKFKATSLKTEKPLEGSSEFVFDTASLGPDWFITDLR